MCKYHFSCQLVMDNAASDLVAYPKVMLLKKIQIRTFDLLKKTSNFNQKK